MLQEDAEIDPSQFGQFLQAETERERTLIVAQKSPLFVMTPCVVPGERMNAACHVVACCANQNQFHERELPILQILCTGAFIILFTKERTQLLFYLYLHPSTTSSCASIVNSSSSSSWYCLLTPLLHQPLPAVIFVAQALNSKPRPWRGSWHLGMVTAAKMVEGTVVMARVLARELLLQRLLVALRWPW